MKSEVRTHIRCVGTSKSCSARRALHDQRGQAMLLAVVLFLAASTAVVLGIANPVLRDVRSVNTLEYSKQSYFLAEGAVEDVSYRLMRGMDVDSTETLTYLNATATVAVVDTSDGKRVTSSATYERAVRKVGLSLKEGDGVSFNYGVQVGAGGLSMTNNSVVSGNVYSNGPISGSNNMTIQGDAVSAGPSGLISGVTVTKNAYANRIQNSVVNGNAYYTTLTGTSVSGTKYPGSPDQPLTDMPMSDEFIENLKDSAAAGGTTSCSSYNITTNVTLGPRKINCSVNISGSAVVTLNGPVWVAGNLTVSNSAQLRVATSLGQSSVAVVVDNPANRSSQSTISLSNNSLYYGSGTAGSYVVLISMNNSAENGGGNTAIDISNNAEGDLVLYASHGKILLSNNADLVEVTGYRVESSNNAVITYKQGLANTLFTSGPSGGYSIEGWGETR